MKRFFVIALLGTSMAGLPMLAGCDKEKETSKSDVEVKHPDGSTSKDKETTSTDAKTGDTKVTTEHKVTGPTTNP